MQIPWFLSRATAEAVTGGIGDKGGQPARTCLVF